MARTYVVTDDPAYEQTYWHILDVRNGIKPRPDGRTVSLRQLMQHQGFTAAEFAKLKQAEDNSNALVATETVAMHAMKGEFDDGIGGYTRKGEPDGELASDRQRSPQCSAHCQPEPQLVRGRCGRARARHDRRPVPPAGDRGSGHRRQ
jgi:hypothetical protein